MKITKKIILIFAIFVLNVLPALSFGLKATKNEAVLDETLGNSIVTQEYPSGSEVQPVQNTEDIDDKTLLIEGSVEKSLDVTLADCLKLALGNNPRIKAALNDALASHARIAQVWSNYFPEFVLESGYNKMSPLQMSSMVGESVKIDYYLLGQATVSQMIYDFGVTQNTATIKKLDYEAYKTSLTGIVNDVICQTKDAYYKLLYAYDARRVAQDTVDKYEMFYNQAKAFYEIGMTPKVDVTIAEVNLSEAKLKLIQAENAIDLAAAGLTNAMGVSYFNKYNVNDTLKFNPVKITIRDAFETARQARPELKLAEIKIEEANQAVKLAKKSYFPILEAQGSYARGGQSWNATYGYNYGIFLNFKSINGMLIKNQIKEAKSLYDKEMALAQNTKNNIHLEIQQAYLTMYEKKNQIPVALLQIKQAKENYDLSFGRYKAGEGNPTELKDAQNIYQTAMLNYYRVLYEYNSSKASLEKAIGKNIVADNESIDLET